MLIKVAITRYLIIAKLRAKLYCVDILEKFRGFLGFS